MGEANILLELNYLENMVRVDTMQKDIFYNTKQCQTFYKKIKCNLLNHREGENGYHQDFQ